MTSGSSTPKAETYFRDTQSLAAAHAIEAEDLAQLETLLRTLDPNQLHVRGMTFLNWAFAHNQIEAARVLLVHGADPNLPTEGVFPWALAMKMDDIRWLKLLVQAGADLNYKWQGTPVWFECYKAGNWDHLNYLLAQGIDYNATDASGNTAMMDLARLGHYGMVLKLLEQGADATPMSSSGVTLIDIVKNAIPSNDGPEARNRKNVLAFLER